MKPPKESLLGAHMSISNGLDNAIIAGQSIGCTAIQIFLHSNRQWHMKDLTQEKIISFIQAKKASTIQAVVVHASYLLNLGSPHAEIRKKSIITLIKELEQCSQLEISALIMHPGSSVNTTLESCVKYIAEGINIALENVQGPTKLLLENTAGQGDALGSTFEELASIKSAIHKKNHIGFCFDTCHAFAAGYDLRTPESYKETFKQFDTILGLKHLYAFHMNDSKKPLGSHIDRHEDIGKGEIGPRGFELILNDARFTHIPKIL